MDDQVEIIVEDEDEPMVHQVAKVVLGALVGFAASQAAGWAYDYVRNRTKDETEDVMITDEV